MNKQALSANAVKRLQEKARTAAQLVQERIYAYKKENNIESLGQLSRTLGFSATTLREYLRPLDSDDPPSLPLKRQLNRLRQHITSISDEDAKLIVSGLEALRRAAATRVARTNRKEDQFKAPRPTRPAPQIGNGSSSLANASTDDLLRTLLQRVASVLPRTETNAVPPTPASSRQVQLVLTTENFQAITPDDVGKGNLEEYVRRGISVLESACLFYNFVAQLEPEDVRCEIIDVVAKTSDDLLLAASAARSAVPSQAIDLLCRQRAAFESHVTSNQP